MLIGEYIHFNYKNYELYSISHKSPVRANPTRVFKGQRQKIKTLYPKKIADGKIKDLENTLNLFFGNSAKINGKSWTSEDMKIIQDAVIAIFTQSMSQAEIDRLDFNDLNAFSAQTMPTIIEMVKNRQTPGQYKAYEEVKRARQKLGIKDVKTNETKSFTSWKAIDFRIDQIQELRKKIEQKAKKGFKEDDFIKTVDKLKTAYEELKKEQKTDRFDLSDEKNKSFIDLLNKTTEYLKNHTSSNMIGKMGEEIPKLTYALVNYAMINGINSITENLEKAAEYCNASMGKVQRSYKQLDKKRVIGGTKEEYLTKSFNNADMKLSYTENKIDAEFVLKDNSIIPASIKNYDIESNEFTVLKGVSILKYIQDYPDFANHYFNITAHHDDKRVDGSLLNDAHEALKMTVGLHALAGGTWGSQTKGGELSKEKMAEVFIVNYHGGGKRGNFKIHLMADLLDKIENNLSLLDIKIDGISDLKSPEWKNEFHGENKSFRDAYYRIANMLGSIHQKGFSVQINKNTLN